MWFNGSSRRSRPIGRYAIRVAIGLGVCGIASLCAATVGCDADGGSTPRTAHAGQPAQEDASSAPRAVAGLSPMETILRLRAFRERGRYSRIERFLLPEQRTAVLSQLRAVDRLIATARLLQRRVRTHLGTGAAQSFAHYAQVGNIIGVFSDDVTLLDEHVDGASARVTFQVAGRLPLGTVSMTRDRDRWLLNADPIDGVPEQLLKLAGMLERLADRVVEEGLSAETLHREIALRQSGILRRLEKLVADAEDASGER